MDIVPELQHNSLLSDSKFADTNYVTVLTPTEVLLYDGNDLKISINSDAILRGWQDKASGLWRIPLEPTTPPPDLKYLLLDKNVEEAISNAYEIPSTAQVIRYLHACACFPTKATWLKAIKGGNYATWPKLTEEAVRKHFPKSDKTQQGHMRGIQQGIRSTKEKKNPSTNQLDDGTTLPLPRMKHNDIYIQVDEAK